MSSSIPPDYNYAELINAIMSTISPDDPFKYLEQMYSCSPAFIQTAVINGKEKLAKINNKKGSNVVDVYFTLGNENMTRSRISGFFSGLLWIEDYIREKKDALKITNAELNTFSKVLNKANIPTISAMRDVLEVGEKPKVQTLRTYAACLGSYAIWLSRASLANKSGSKVTRSNVEACNLLTAGCLNSYPALPFTSYYLGTIKTNEDVLAISEKMYKESRFDDYITDEFAQINAPSFLVCKAGSPVVNCVNHPLCMKTIGLTSSNGPDSNITWHAGYAHAREFDQLCQKHNTSSAAVSKYIITTSWEQHQENVRKNDPLALFIEKQKIVKEIYERFRESSGLLTEKIDDLEKKDYE